LANIHPSATIDPKAEIATDAQIGPGCVIQGPVTIGPGCRLIGNVYLQGPVTLGRDNTLYPFVCIGFEPQALTPSDSPHGVVLGNNNVLRESVTIHRASQDDRPTTVGNDNFLMTNTHLAHDVALGNQCVLASGALVGGHVIVEDQVNLGGNSAVHQFCRMGRMSFLGGVSALMKDLPPFATASGINNVIGANLVGLRRSGVDRPAIDAVKEAFKTLYLSRHTTPVAVDLIEQTASRNGPGTQMLTEMVAFIRGSTRGLCPHAAAAQNQRLRR